MNNSKRPLKWFEDRVGSFIFRSAFFCNERSPVSIKVSTKAHAKQLHDLQRNGRPQYYDNAEQIKIA